MGFYNLYELQRKEVRYAHTYMQKDFPAYFIANKIAQKRQNVYFSVPGSAILNVDQRLMIRRLTETIHI